MAMLGSALLLVVPVWAAALVTPGPDTLAEPKVAIQFPNRSRMAGTWTWSPL